MDRLYRLLLLILPADFRVEFGPEMEGVFREQRRRAEREKGRIGVLRLWAETFAGIVRTAPAEHLAMLLQDTRYALRVMRQNAGYTATAVLTLALGIGANTAIFSVVNAVLLRPLPYRQGHELVVLHQPVRKAGLQDMGFSVPEIIDYRKQNHSFRAIAEYHSMRFTLLSGNEAERIRAGVVSSGFFELLGVQPLLGRTFVPADDLPGAPPVLLLSYEYWMQHQGGNAAIVGRTLQMNDKAHLVIGVLPAVPQYPDENDVYMPTSACPTRSSARVIANRDFRMMSLLGRLKPGVTLEDSRKDLARIAERLETSYPKSYTQAMGVTAVAAPLEQELTEQARPTLLLLIAASGFVFLIACANVANLALARMARREREMLVRSALGAGKGRLLRQLVTESLILGLLSAATGWLFAVSGMKLLVEFTNRLSPRAREIRIDGSMLAYALLAAVVASIVFGSISALYSRGDLSSGLKEVNRRPRRTRSLLIVCQVAFSFVLLAGAVLMLRTLSNLNRVDAGFTPQRVLAVNISLNWSKYKNRDQWRDVANQILAKVRSLPGVISAAVSSSFPLQSATDPAVQDLWIEGKPHRGSDALNLSTIRVATPGYFETLGIPLLRGRLFTEQDDQKAPMAALINECLALHFWSGGNPVGKKLSMDRGETWITIAGVVGNVREFGLNQEPKDEVYLAMAQNPNPGTVLVRTDAGPSTLIQQVRRAVLEVDPQTAIPNVETLEQARNESIAKQRVITNLLGIFAALALIVAASGIGGILALAVNERTHEIGIRVALGAKPAHVFRVVVCQGLTLVAIGLVFGLAVAEIFTPLLRTMLFQVTPGDPLTFLAVSGLLAASALLACCVPARRATKIDPLIALRQD